MYIFCYYFLIFFIYSVAGWFIEVTISSIDSKQISNRGFLIGPYCPIYGFGALILSVCLSQYRSDVAVLFCVSVVFCSVLEYFTSWIMEKLFHARWWDYSKIKFNVEGRICLTNSIYFGILGVLLVRFISPFLMHSLNAIPKNTLIMITIPFLLLLMIDLCLSSVIMNRLKKTINNIRKEDSTVEMSTRVKEVLKNQTFFIKRLIKAFPNIKILPLKRKKQ